MFIWVKIIAWHSCPINYNTETCCIITHTINEQSTRSWYCSFNSYICFADLNMQPRHWKHARDTILFLQESYLLYDSLALGRITLSTRWLLRSTKRRTAKLGTYFTTWVINPLPVWIISNVNKSRKKSCNINKIIWTFLFY